jgi:steroid 5-alpha reductase family enzyme
MEKEKSASVLGIILVVLIAAGLAWAGSQNSLRAFGMPLFALCIGLAFVIQWLVFIPAYFFRTEKYFDLTGSLTYITVILAAMIFSESVDTRSFFLAGMVVIWAVRLGSFLFKRILKSGKDSRFDAIKLDFLRFLQTWTLQGLWISFTLAAALAAITSQLKVSMDGSALAGILVWAAGISIEAVADRQKSEFRKDPGNEGKFIQTGLWSWSRHPNYFGEIVLWVGVAIVALPVLYGWRLLTLVSPLFVFLLLTRVSGVPMLEKRADGKWGGQANYDAYKARTSILIPLPPRKQ